MTIKKLIFSILMIIFAAPVHAELNLLPDRCIEKRLTSCLLENVVERRVAKGGLLQMRYLGLPSGNFSGDGRLVEAVLNAGDENLARKLLPLAEDATAARSALLFTAGEIKAGQEQLQSWRKKDNDANGEMAIWALLRRGDLEGALNVAKLTVEWYPPPPDKLIYMTGDCINYPAYPVAKLAKELALKRRYAQAHEALALLKQRFVDPRTRTNYIGGSCNATIARWAYARGVLDAGRALAEGGGNGEASTLLKDFVALYDTGKVLLNFYHFPDFADLAAFAIDIGDIETATAIAARAEKEAEKPTIYSSSMDFDEAAFTIAVTGEYGKALARISNEKDADRQMNTLIQIMNLAFASDAKDHGVDLVKEMENRAGHRKEKIKNLYDLASIAERYADLGRMEDSRRVFKSLQAQYNEDESYMNRRLAVLFVRHKDWKALDALLGEPRTFDYNFGEGEFLSALLVPLAKDGAWDDFDRIFKLYEPKFRALDTNKRFKISKDLLETLIGLKQFDRYFIVMGNPANEKWTQWMLEPIVIAFAGGDIPREVFEKAWHAYAKSCENYEKSWPEERADECVFGLLRSITMRSFLKYDRYPLTGVK